MTVDNIDMMRMPGPVIGPLLDSGVEDAPHGIGTARAFQVDAVAGVFAGITMSLNALVTSLLVTLLMG